MSLNIAILNLILPFVIFLFNWRINRNAVFLSLLLFLIGTSNIRHALVMHAQDPFWLAVVTTNLTPLWTLIGPCLYLYVRGVLTDRFEWKRSDLLHTIPFWINLVGIVPYLLTPFEYKLQVAEGMIRRLEDFKDIRVNWLLPQGLNLSFRPILQLGYALACMAMLVGYARSGKRRSGHVSRQSGFVYAWLWGVTLFVFLVAAYHLLILFLYYRNPDMGRRMIQNFQSVYVIGGALTFMPFLILLFPNILYGIPRYRPLMKAKSAEAATPDSPKEAPVESLPIEHPKAEVINGDPFQELGDRILAFMEQEKPHLREDFSMDHLSMSLDVPKHHIHYCLKNILQTRFVPMRTAYRIADAKLLLLKADLEKTTFENIGQQCGFSSRSAFYKVFKSETGLSPGEYVEQNREAENPTASSLRMAFGNSKG